uniref:Putative product n=1 Tax=Xenopsylla cheopis TaxID=163159 RepID=A0A6M2DVQ0_XENCH
MMKLVAPVRMPVFIVDIVLLLNVPLVVSSVDICMLLSLEPHITSCVRAVTIFGGVRVKFVRPLHHLVVHSRSKITKSIYHVECGWIMMICFDWLESNCFVLIQLMVMKKMGKKFQKKMFPKMVLKRMMLSKLPNRYCLLHWIEKLFP